MRGLVDTKAQVRQTPIGVPRGGRRTGSSDHEGERGVTDPLNPPQDHPHSVQEQHDAEEQEREGEREREKPTAV